MELVFAKSNGIITEKRPAIEYDPDGLRPGDEVFFGPIRFPFSEGSRYYIGTLSISHPDDEEPANNSYEPTHEERIEGLRGNRFVGGGDLGQALCD